MVHQLMNTQSMWYMYEVEYYSAIKSELWSCVTTWRSGDHGVKQDKPGKESPHNLMYNF